MRQSLTFGQSCGKFLAILSVVARHDPVIAKRVQYGPSNAKYTHHTMQNALLDITKDMTLEQIREELSKAVYFTVLADESKDTSKKEQVVVAVQYFLNNGIQEEFVRIAETQSLDVDNRFEYFTHGTKVTDPQLSCVLEYQRSSWYRQSVHVHIS